MKKHIYSILILALAISVFSGCGSRSDVKTQEPAASTLTETIMQEQQPGAEAPSLPQEEAAEAEEQLITEEQALSAVRNYCYTVNPDLESIVNEGQYPVYWEVASTVENEIVVIYRSYTGAQNRFYIDRTTGETYVTEFVPTIMEDEDPTGEEFQIKDYI